MEVPSFLDQVRLVETFLGRELPERVRALFHPDSWIARRLLPLATGRERDPLERGARPEERFAAASAKLDSVLGHAIGKAELQRFDPDSVWPPGLVVIQDCGGAVYRAVDLDDPHLRIVEHEHLDPVADPQAAVGPDDRLAYAEPAVPRQLQHRFIVAAASLDDWLRSFGSQP